MSIIIVSMRTVHPGDLSVQVTVSTPILTAQNLCSHWQHSAVKIGRSPNTPTRADLGGWAGQVVVSSRVITQWPCTSAGSGYYIMTLYTGALDSTRRHWAEVKVDSLLSQSNLTGILLDNLISPWITFNFEKYGHADMLLYYRLIFSNYNITSKAVKKEF